MNKEEIEKNLKDKSNWTRLLFMVLFAIAYSVAEVVFCALVVFQFLSKVTTGVVNEKVAAFLSAITLYIKQILDFLSYASETKPYPLSDWPSAA